MKFFFDTPLNNQLNATTMAIAKLFFKNPLGKQPGKVNRLVPTAIVAFLLLCITTAGFPQNVSINTTGVAANASAIPDLNTGNTFTSSTGGYQVHTIGESYGGGIVFYVYDGGQHGLIAATADQSTAIQWYNGTFKYMGTTGDGVGAGAKNTAMIVATQISDNLTGNFAAKVCADYSVTVGGVTYSDWYLPSKFELNLLYLQKSVVGGFANYYYWSSTEVSSNGAWFQYFNNGFQFDNDKNIINDVRAVRAF